MPEPAPQVLMRPSSQGRNSGTCAQHVHTAPNRNQPRGSGQLQDRLEERQNLALFSLRIAPHVSVAYSGLIRAVGGQAIHVGGRVEGVAVVELAAGRSDSSAGKDEPGSKNPWPQAPKISRRMVG